MHKGEIFEGAAGLFTRAGGNKWPIMLASASEWVSGEPVLFIALKDCRHWLGLG